MTKSSGKSNPHPSTKVAGDFWNDSNAHQPTENPTVEPNMKWIGRPIAEIWPFEIFQDARLVEWSSVGPQYIHIPMSYIPLRYVRNVAYEK